MQYSIFVTDRQAEVIKAKLTDQVKSITPHKDGMVKVELDITNNVDLVVLFFAGVDYGIQEAASILQR